MASHPSPEHSLKDVLAEWTVHSNEIDCHVKKRLIMKSANGSTMVVEKLEKYDYSSDSWESMNDGWTVRSANVDIMNRE